MAENPSVLILDEPTEHLLPEGVAELFREIKEVVQRRAAVVYISHRIHEVKQVANTISVLRDGALDGTFPAADVTEHDIIDLIVGRKLEARFPPKADPKTFGDTVLNGRRTSPASAIPGFDGGSPGRDRRSGRASTATVNARRCARSRASARRRGTVEIGGKRVSLRGPSSSKKAGFSYLPNDRHTEGVLPSLSVRENATVRALEDLAVAGVVQPVKERRVIREQIKAYNIKTPSSETPIDSLSGGNQQKVMLSRTLLTGSPVVLADEPTQGVDVGARAEIYTILRKAAGDGACVLVCSSDASELEGLCDRVLIFSRGNIVTELAGDDNTEHRITESALTATAERHRGSRSTRRLPTSCAGSRRATSPRRSCWRSRS